MISRRNAALVVPLTDRWTVILRRSSSHESYISTSPLSSPGRETANRSTGLVTSALVLVTFVFFLDGADAFSRSGDGSSFSSAFRLRVFM